MTRTTNAGRILSGVALVAAALLAAPGVAAAQGSSDVVSADADVDGDGVANPVTLQQVAPGTQLLRVGLAEGHVDARAEGDESLPLIVPFVVDVNGDGRDELVLATALGVNTTTFEVWGLDDGRLHAVTGEDGAPWRLYEGGGVSAVGAYGCVPGTPGRRLRVVQAEIDWEASADRTPLYDGAVTTYVVADGVAHPAATEPFQDVIREDPRAQADPATCTPLD